MRQSQVNLVPGAFFLAWGGAREKDLGTRLIHKWLDISGFHLLQDQVKTTKPLREIMSQ